MSKEISRRAFLEDAGKVGLGAALAGHLPTIVPRHVLGGKGFTPPSSLLNIAVVGVGGQGSGNGKSVVSENLVAFCDVDLVACPTSLTKYTDVNDCVSKCHNWGQGFTGPILDSTGNTLQCRVYHLELSQTGDPNDLTTHCPHTGDDSARCQSTDGGTDAGGDAGADAAADATAD